MDTLKLKISGVAPLSTNKLNSFNRYGGNKNGGIKKRTIEAVNSQLLNYNSQIKEFKRNFDKKNEVITAYYKFNFPKHIFFTKKGDISSKRVDFDNCIKLAQDTITRYIDIDDKYIVDGIIEVRPAEDFCWSISYSKLHRDFLF